MIRFVLALWLVAAALPARAAVDIQTLTTPGGIDVWLVEEHSIPFTALEIRFKGGTTLDPAGKRGVVNLMTGLLEEGAGALDSRGFSAAREALAASLEYRAYDDVIAISARFLTENRDQAVALLKSSIMEPNFDQVDIDRVREQVLSSIRSDKTDPGAIARRTFDSLAWGDHPYGTSDEGTEDSVNALTRDDIMAAHDAAFARDRLFVSAVGDITAAELSVLLDQLFGDLPATGAPLAEPASYLLNGGITVVPFDTPQSVAIFGHQGIKRDDPDYMTAYILNEVFGGDGQDSRLMTEVREKRGLTYGIGTALLPMDYSELIVGRVQSDNSKMAEAVKVIQDEWAKVAADAITEEELADAKTYLTGAYALRFDGNAPIARIMVGMQMIDLPPGYVTERNDQVMAVMMEDIRRVAKRIYQPENLHFVVVGRPEGLDSTN
ncbi:MAG: pitrilysin family protein [Paracoccaceae bacterium]